jgi:hypothetical protein
MEEGILVIYEKCCDEVQINNEYICTIFQWLIDNGYDITKNIK